MKDKPDIENIIKVENVNFAYDGAPVLNDLSFTVRKGSFHINSWPEWFREKHAYKPFKQGA